MGKPMKGRMVRVCWIVLSLAGAVHAQQDDSKGQLLAAYIGIADNPQHVEQAMRADEIAEALPSLYAYVRDETVTAVFAFANFARDDEGLAHMTCGFELSRPDGSVLFENDSYAGAGGTPSATASWGMLDPALDIVFDDTDPSGPYTLKIIVRDEISGATADAAHILALVDSGERKALLNKPLNVAEVLDELWADFAIHGDDLAIRRIVGALPWRDQGHGMQLVIGAAAQWSLDSQMRNLPKVLRICEGLARELESPGREELERLVVEVKKSISATN